MKYCKEGKPCNGVDLLHHDNEQAVGLYVVQALNTKTNKLGRYIGYRFPNSMKLGNVWLNFCPWCGVEQRPKSKQPKQRQLTVKKRPSAAKEQ